MRNAFRTSKKRSNTLKNSIDRFFHPEQLESRVLLSTYILNATEDTFGRGAGFGDIIYNERSGNCALPLAGTSCLLVQNDNGTNSGGNTRITYLKFDTSGLSGTVNSATLRLTGMVASGTESFPGAKHDEVHGVPDASWTESTLTFNNRPLLDATVLDSQVISGSTFKTYNWNVVGWANGHTGGPLAFAVQETEQSSLVHQYRTHEWSNDADRPKLILGVGTPDAPTGLSGTASISTVNLSWSLLEADGNPVDAATWSIYRGTASGQEQLIASNVTTNNYTDSPIANGMDYFYYVVATNASGVSAPSAEVGPLRPMLTTVGPPSPIAVTEGIGTIRLSWAAVPFADTYRIYRSDTSGGTFVLQTEQAATTFDDNVGAGARFYYKVSAVNGAGEGPLSPEIAATGGIIGSGSGISATYYDNIDFTGPTVTRVDSTIDFDFLDGSPDAAIGVDTFSARWLGDVQAVYTQPYTFYTRTDDGVRLWVNDTLVIDKWIDQGATTWASNPVNLVAGQKYHIRMDFYENGGFANVILSWSSPSTPTEVVPTSQLYPYDGLPRVAAPPANVSANALDATSICVLWSDLADDEDRFVVQRSTSPDFTGAVEISTPAVPNVGGCKDTTVTTGTPYYYRVLARNAVGDSPFTIANQQSIASLARASNVTTITAAAPHGLSVGNSVTIFGATPASFNGTFTVATVPSPTTFTIANAGPNDTALLAGSFFTPVIPATPSPVNFNPFPATSNDLRFVGNGFGAGPLLSGGRLRLVDAVDNAGGAAWTTNPKSIDSFTSSFDLQITNSNGADGLVFVIQANGNNVLAGAGGGLGFAGMPRSVGIKFDFYPNINQTGVYTNGAMNDTIGNTLNTAFELIGFGIDFDRTVSGVAGGNGNIFHVDVAYDGASLIWTITDTTDRTHIASGQQTVDIAGIIGSHCAFIGFTAANGGLHARQEIVNFNFNTNGPIVNGTPNPDTFYVRLNAPGGNRVNIWKNHNPAIDPPDVDMLRADATNLTLTGGGLTDTFTIDFTNGNPLPTGGLFVDGGMQADTLIVKGTSAAETFSINATQVTVPGGGTFRHSGIDFANFILGDNVAGDPDDSLNITAAPGFSPTLSGGGGNNTITIPGGNYTASVDNLAGNNDGAGNATLNVVASGTTSITSTSSQHLKTLTLNDTSKLILAQGGSKLLRTRGLTIASGAALDVGDGDVILQSTAAAKIAAWNTLMTLLRSGRNGGLWTGNGVRSAAAAGNSQHATGVGIILNDNGSATPILATFNGEAVDANTILLKYTYYGDRDFDGDIDADDYAGIDGGFANRGNPNNLVFPRQPWRNGDINLGNSVNSDDYFMIDNAFSNQTGVLSVPAAPMAASSTTATKSAAKSSSKQRKVSHHRNILFRVRD